jgi:glycosyl transferase family 2
MPEKRPLAKHDGKQVLRGVPSTPDGRPAITVVVPSYNYARYLTECADSVLSQRDVDVRLVIVDDCSTDDTPLVTAALAAADARVTVIRNAVNRGHIPSVNAGLAAVTTEYVVKLDADDLLAPGALARATALLAAHPEVSFVYGRPEHFSGPAPELSDAPTRSWTIWPGRDWVARRCETASNAISQPEVVVRTAMLRSVGEVATDLPHTSDLHQWLRLASVGDVGRINGPVQGCYRVHDASMQRTVHNGVLFDLQARRDAFAAAFAGMAGALPAAGELHDNARRRLAANALDRACRAYDRGRTDEVPVDELVAFALDVWPEARQLPGWRSLQRRKAVGARRAPRDPRFLAAAVTRRAREERGRKRWLRTGEYR